jgi:hypothetical protein
MMVLAFKGVWVPVFPRYKYLRVGEVTVSTSNPHTSISNCLNTSYLGLVVSAATPHLFVGYGL